MIKQFLMGAVFIAAGTVSVAAQQRDVILRKIQISGTDFDIVLAMSTPPAIPIFRLAVGKDPLVTYPIGGELAYAAPGEIENMLREVDSSSMPTHAFRVEINGAGSNALNMYVVPRTAAGSSAEPPASPAPRKRSEGGAAPLVNFAFGSLPLRGFSDADSSLRRQLADATQPK